MSEVVRVQQEPDALPALRLLRLVALAVCVSALGVLVSWWMMPRNPADHPLDRPAASAAFTEGTPEQTPIETTQRGLALKAAQRHRLSQYGWADRKAGVARIPIERAIELRANGVR